jgi:hypothetical protein
MWLAGWRLVTREAYCNVVDVGNIIKTASNERMLVLWVVESDWEDWCWMDKMIIFRARRCNYTGKMRHYQAADLTTRSEFVRSIYPPDVCGLCNGCCYLRK